MESLFGSSDEGEADAGPNSETPKKKGSEVKPGFKWGFPKMVGFPNKPMGFPTKNDHFGVLWGTTI